MCPVEPQQNLGWSSASVLEQGRFLSSPSGPRGAWPLLHLLSWSLLLWRSLLSVLGFELCFSQELCLGFILCVLKGAVVMIAGDGLNPPNSQKPCSGALQAELPGGTFCVSISAVEHVWANSLWSPRAFFFPGEFLMSQKHFWIYYLNLSHLEEFCLQWFVLGAHLLLFQGAELERRDKLMDLLCPP